MNRLQNLIRGALNKEVVHFQAKFSAHSINIAGIDYWNEVSLRNFLAVESSSSFLYLRDEVSPILFEVLQYLGCFPFRMNGGQPRPAAITCDELLSAVFWLLPGKAQKGTGAGTIGNDIYMRARSAADQRRLLFESLANVNEEFPFDMEEEKRVATEKSQEVDERLLDMALRNYDDEDEMYHDVLDVLSYTQESLKKENELPCRRDDFRFIASQLHKPTSLRRLAISRHRFKSLIKFLLAEHMKSENLPQAVELENVADTLVNAFSQGSESTGVITWQKFDEALKKKAPFIFSSLYRIFNSLLTSIDNHNDDYEAFTQPSLSPNHLLSSTTLSQLSFLLDSTASFETAPLLYQFNKDQSTPIVDAVFEINSALKSMSDSSDFKILLVSGREKFTTETFVFGAFIKDLTEGLEIVELEDKAYERSFLFQISPIHDVFRSNVGNKAWYLDKSLCFGSNDSGFSMRLDGDLNQLHVSHKLAGEGVYQSTKWRGEWGMVLDIDNVEVWGE
ncbi:hypothetical protein BGZ60DRAFT_425164 [Tricladium varicosporioides]|nr:hypothetical protein BGZ60DRAFT_425164 [Hymenoscyphus varicosporioides]